MDIGKVIRELKVELDEELVPTRKEHVPDEESPRAPAPAEPEAVPA